MGEWLQSQIWRRALAKGLRRGLPKGLGQNDLAKNSGEGLARSLGDKRAGRLGDSPRNISKTVDQFFNFPVCGLGSNFGGKREINRSTYCSWHFQRSMACALHATRSLSQVREEPLRVINCERGDKRSLARSIGLFLFGASEALRSWEARNVHSDVKQPWASPVLVSGE